MDRNYEPWVLVSWTNGSNSRFADLRISCFFASNIPKRFPSLTSCDKLCDAVNGRPDLRNGPWKPGTLAAVGLQSEVNTAHIPVLFIPNHQLVLLESTSLFIDLSLRVWLYMHVCIIYIYIHTHIITHISPGWFLMKSPRPKSMHLSSASWWWKIPGWVWWSKRVEYLYSGRTL